MVCSPLPLESFLPAKASYSIAVQSSEEKFAGKEKGQVYTFSLGTPAQAVITGSEDIVTLGYLQDINLIQYIKGIVLTLLNEQKVDSIIMHQSKEDKYSVVFHIEIFVGLRFREH